MHLHHSFRPEWGGGRESFSESGKGDREKIDLGKWSSVKVIHSSLRIFIKNHLSHSLEYIIIRYLLVLCSLKQNVIMDVSF